MSERLRVLGVDAEHPDEKPAGEPVDALLHELHARPVEGVESIIGNPDAYAQTDINTQRLRWVAENLTFATVFVFLIFLIIFFTMLTLASMYSVQLVHWQHKMSLRCPSISRPLHLTQAYQIILALILGQTHPLRQLYSEMY
jgi:hypothetical protein